MATVPGTPDNITTLHPAFRPTDADILQAASIVYGRQQAAESQVETDSSKGPQKLAAATPLPASIEDALTSYDKGQLNAAGVRKVMTPTGWDIRFGRGRMEHQLIDPAGNYHWERDIR
jgi:hypothetical protein